MSLGHGKNGEKRAKTSTEGVWDGHPSARSRKDGRPWAMAWRGDEEKGCRTDVPAMGGAGRGTGRTEEADEEKR